MKITKAIITSTFNKKYLDFWPMVKKSWECLGVEPVLYIISNKKSKYKEAINFWIDGINPIFLSQNARLVLPHFHSEDICIISDIDIIPLSKNYFIDSLKGYKDNEFIVLRSDACPPNMLPICWNVAKGSTWSDVFSINSEEDIKTTLNNWYPKDFNKKSSHWYIDQVNLKENLNLFKKKYPNRVIELNDEILDFNRLNRDNYKKNLKEYLKEGKNFSDFHMPRPYFIYQKSINKVFEKFVDS